MKHPNPDTAVPFRAEHRVAIVVYDGVKLLDVAGPADVFAEANRLGADYRVHLVSPSGLDVTTSIHACVAPSLGARRAGFHLRTRRHDLHLGRRQRRHRPRAST